MGETQNLETELYFLFTFILLSTSFILQHVVRLLKFDKYIPDVIYVIVYALLVSILIDLLTSNVTLWKNNFDSKFMSFDTEFFYFILLPPIIFESGYHLRRRHLYDNFGAIFVLAIFGTIVSIAFIAWGLYESQKAFLYTNSGYQLNMIECVAFAALIASTDPISTLSIYSQRKVNSALYYLVFGESILNDAVALTVFSVAKNFGNKEFDVQMGIHLSLRILISFTVSTFIGYSIGIIISYLLKLLKCKEKDFVVVLVILTCGAYSSFLIVELCHFSGIVAILFTGIATRRYASKNISDTCRWICSSFFTLIAKTSELYCFVLVGLSTITGMKNDFNCYLALFSLALILASRFVIYPLLSLVNIYRQYRQGSTDGQIPLKHMHMIYFAGLRGAVAFACANAFPDTRGNRKAVIGATIFIILVTLLTQGGLTDTLLACLNITSDETEKPQTGITSNVCSNEELKQTGIRDLERKYLYPLIIGPDRKSRGKLGAYSPTQSTVSSGGGSYVGLPH